MNKRFFVTLIVIITTILSSFAWAVEYRGRVTITEKNKPSTAVEYADLVVFFIPKEVKGGAKLSPETMEIRMENKRFNPRVLTVTAGSTVEFPNFDPVLHNAFSTSGRNRFDLGFYSGGDKKAHTFNSPGLVRVYCNVHHDMVAYILVLNTPHFTSVSSDGNFKFENLPGVAGQLQIWHPRAKVVKKTLELSGEIEQDAEYQVTLTKRRIPKHLNKKGKSYTKSRKRRY